MGRKKNTTYVDAAFSVLTELGGGPVRSRDLVKAIEDKGLVPQGEYTYHYILKAVRDNPQTFNTAQRGYIALAGAAVQEVQETGDPDAAVTKAVPAASAF